MRYSTGLFTAVLALMICGTWLTSAAQGPGGSYRETCRDIGVRGSTLYATCRDVNNEWRETRLDGFQSCGADIQNQNGNLTCSGEGGGYGYRRDRDYDHDRDRDHDRDYDRDRDRDQGYGGDRDSYRQTCQDVRNDGNKLRARCQKADGGWRNTSLKDFNQCRNIVNEDGHLRCR